VSLVLLFAGGSQLIQGLERTAYDWGVRASSRTPSDKIAINRDRQAEHRQHRSLAWSREVHAKMVERLASAKAKVIGYTVFFSEPQVDPASSMSTGSSRPTARSFRRT